MVLEDERSYSLAYLRDGLGSEAGNDILLHNVVDVEGLL